MHGLPPADTCMAPPGSSFLIICSAIRHTYKKRFVIALDGDQPDYAGDWLNQYDTTSGATVVASALEIL
jgi:hypothetical protein